MSTGCPLCSRVEPTAFHADPDFVREFDHSVAFLGRWQAYRGYCVLVSKRHARELSELTDDVRRGFFDEMCMVARAIETAFTPRKLNYEMLGNQVPHLHWHVFPRYEDDPNALQAVWLSIAAAERDAEAAKRFELGVTSREETIARLRRELERLQA